ncbi:anaphase-promoting complex subunit-like protein [Sarcoptes scabiei]|uniref:Anaphase-promoting complex subunit-like protein n=1 Tax=Sarcoptes scabiei TaxID=52283 RepID=A0A132AER2_SARSC|nr:anaphase-promoting complex subunit-like protein [Sarcoptes scabiei]
MANFRKISQQNILNEILNIKINPLMDIVALDLISSDIIINRLYSWQRVLSINKPKSKCKPDQTTNESPTIKVSALCWQVKSYPSEDDPKLSKPLNIDKIKFPLDSINIPYLDLFICDEKIFNYPKNFSKSQSSSKSFHPKLPSFDKFHKTNEFDAFDRMKILKNKTINFLVVATNQNQILFFLFGFYPVLKIDLKDFDHKLEFPNRKSRIIKVWLAPDLNSVQVLLSDIDDPDGKRQQFISIETKILDSCWKEIFLTNRIRLNIDIRLEFLQNSVNEINQMWSDTVTDLKARLNCTDFSINANDTSKPYLNFDRNFIDMIIFGNISLSLERFLQQLDEKDFKKMYESFQSCVDKMYQLSITKIQNTLIQILCCLDNLKGMVLNDIQFGQLGFSIEHINLFRWEIINMIEKDNSLMISLYDLKCRMLAFTRLLYKGLSMIQNEKIDLENFKPTDDQTLGKMTVQDFHLIMDFLNIDDCSQDQPYKQPNVIDKILKGSLTIESKECHCKTFRNDFDNFDVDQNYRCDKITNPLCNPYKAFCDEQNYNDLIDALRSKEKDDILAMKESDLFDIFRKQKRLKEFKCENLFENDPDRTREWFESYLDDYSRFDPPDEEISNDWSFKNQLKRIEMIRKLTFGQSYHKLNSNQSNLFKTDTDGNFRYLFERSSPQTALDEPSLLDCRIVLEPLADRNLTESCLFLAKSVLNEKGENYLQLSRWKHFYSKSFHRIGISLRAKCSSDCFCDDPLIFKILNFQFYDSESLTLIVSLQHASSNDDDTLNMQQYLCQFSYRKLFEIYLKSHKEDISAQENIPKATFNIDLTKSLNIIHNVSIDSMDVGADFEMIDDDESNENLIYEQLFKLRLLDSNVRQKYLSVSGDRKLACCQDFSRNIITTFEMDSIEDEDEDDVEAEGGAENDQGAQVDD